MESIIIVVHVIAAVAIIGLVLIQHGKGADMGASFGSGSSQTVFGSLGAGNVLTKSTTILAVVFFVTSLGLAMIARESANQTLQNGSLIGDIEQVTADLNAESALTESLPETIGASDIPVIEPTLDDLPVLDDVPVLNDVPIIESVEE